jgi:hypothetical protein
VPFAQLATPSTTGIIILRIELFQETSETSQQEIVTFTRRSTASTMAAGVVPVAVNAGDPVSLLTGGSTTVCGTGIATVTGSLTDTPYRWAFNATLGLTVVFTPDDAPTVSKSSFCTLQFLTAPAANTWSGQIILREANV